MVIAAGYLYHLVLLPQIISQSSPHKSFYPSLNTKARTCARSESAAFICDLCGKNLCGGGVKKHFIYKSLAFLILQDIL